MNVEPTGPPPDETVGILFVHGMGEHHRGSVLRQFGEPLLRWFHGWLGGGRAGAPKRLRARSASFLVPRPDEPEAPAYTEVDIEIPGPGGSTRLVRWVAVDGWWQDEIAQPPFRQVASWGLGLAPWMVARHVRQRAHGILVPLALPIVLLFQCVILALSLLAIVPQLREPVARLQLAITGSLGDVMVMVASPLQLAAMATRLRRQLAWLEDRTGRGPIAVIAHSQGTGVAREALLECRTPVRLLVTFGAALEKLRIAQLVQRNGRRLALGSSLSIAGVVLLTLALATWLAEDSFSDMAFDRADRWARALLAAGVVTLLGVMGLWFHLQRAYAVALTAVGTLLVLDGMALLGGGALAADDRWTDALVAVFRHNPVDWSMPGGWGRAALVLFALGLAIVAVRVVEMVLIRRRRAEPWPDPTLRWARSPRYRKVAGWLLDPTSPLGNVVAAAALIGGLLCLALASGQTAGDDAPVVDAIVLLACAGLAFSFAAIPIPVPGITEATPGEFRLPIDRPEPLWLNFWAPGDLVPDHDLPNPVGGEPHVHNYVVRNQDSLLADHTTYPENTEEFLSRVAAGLAWMVGWDLFTPEDETAVSRAQGRRRARVRFLTVARWVAVAGMVATWWVLGAGGLRVVGQPLEAIVSWLAGILPEGASDAVRSFVSAAVLVGLVVAGITIFWYRVLLVAAWRYWDDVEATWLYRRGQEAEDVILERKLASLVFALGSVAGLAAAVWSPNLLALADRHLGLVGARQVETTGSWTDYLRALPWERSTLPGFGIWGLPWGWIGLITLAATVAWWVALLAISRLAEGGRLFSVRAPVLLPPPAPSAPPSAPRSGGTMPPRS